LGKEKIVKKFVGCQTNKQKEACLLPKRTQSFSLPLPREIGNKERSGVTGGFIIIIIIINGEISPYDEICSNFIRK
jgi:hypothetical protein